jgi:apolipoprotein N-acyltransferase
MKRQGKIGLSILSGVLLSLGWYEWGNGLFLLVGLIPLLFVEEYISSDPNIQRKNSQAFLYGSLSFLTWNLIDTWWIKNASFPGMIAAVIVSSFFTAIPFWFYTYTRKIWGRYAGYVALIIFWLAYEFSYTHGEISWPWLILGNGFAFNIKLIQWYEYTGVFGGTLWVLTVNILLFELLRRLYKAERIRSNKTLAIAGFLAIAVPIGLSLIRYYSYKEQSNPQEIVIVQPNIDPYLKFNDIPSVEQTQIQISLAEKYVTPSTNYVICPETSINHNIWTDQIPNVVDIRMVKEFVMKHPGINYITGITCYKRYTPEEKTETSRLLEGSGFYYDSYNSAIEIDSTDKIQIYNKSKLVVGVEKMPYPAILKILQPLTLRLGGTFRSNATQKERSVLTSSDNQVNVGTVICYESVYGEFVTGYVRKGANLIFVITNDGWWGNTPGHRQHNALSSIRAVETRRSIARSANTGISCFINQRGDVLEKLTWWKSDALRDKLNVNHELTFYVRHGDYIARIAFYSAVILFLLILIKRIRKR